MPVKTGESHTGANSAKEFIVVKGTNGNGLKGGLGGGQDFRNSLKTAVTAKVPPKLALPPQTKIDGEGARNLRLQIEAVHEEDERVAPSAADWMEKVILPELDEIETMLGQVGPALFDQIYGMNEEGEQVTFGQKRNEYLGLYDMYMNAHLPVGEAANGKKPLDFPCPCTRRMAHMALIKHRLKDPLSKKQLLETIKQFVGDGYFLDDSEGLIRPWGKRYALSDSDRFGGLGETEERMVADIIGHHVNRLNSANLAESQKKSEELAKAAEDGGISLEELLEGKEGVCFVRVPPAFSSHDDQSILEVDLLVECDGGGERGKAFIVDASGSDEKAALAIKENKTHLWLFMVQGTRPPRLETLMDKGLDEEKAKQVQRFWTYLRRARGVMESQKRKEQAAVASKQREEQAAVASKQRDELLQKGAAEANDLKASYLASLDLVPVDKAFLEEVPPEGTFLVEFAGEWHNPDNSVIPAGLLYFLAEQKMLADKKGNTCLQVRVKAAPEHLAKLFFRPECFEFAPSGWHFNGLAQPLQGVMKAAFRQIKQALGERVPAQA